MLENVKIRIRVHPADGGKPRKHDMNFKELSALMNQVTPRDYGRFWIERAIVPVPGGDRIEFWCWL